jgi:hypothetical protein
MLNCIADGRVSAVPAVPAHGHGCGCGEDREDLAVRAAAASGGRCSRQTKEASSTSAAGGQSVSHLKRAGGGGAGDAHRCLHVVVVVGARWKSRAGSARTAAKDRSCASSIASRRAPIVYRLSAVVYRTTGPGAETLRLSTTLHEPWPSAARRYDSPPRPRCCCALPLAVPTSDAPWSSMPLHEARPDVEGCR